MSEAQEKEITKAGGKIAFVDYLILDDPPYLQAQECTSCGARYFDRRNACASCFEDQFRSVAIDREGIVTSFSIVQMGPIPYVSAVVDCAGTSVKCTIMNVEPSPVHDCAFDAGSCAINHCGYVWNRSHLNNAEACDNPLLINSYRTKLILKTASAGISSVKVPRATTRTFLSLQIRRIVKN